MESNAFEALRDATRESRLVGDKLRDLIGSSNRHGDLQVVRSSALRLIQCVDQMINYEQEALAGPPSPPAEEHAFDYLPEPTPGRRRLVQPTPTKGPAPAPQPAAEERGANGRVSGLQAALLKLIEKSPGKHTSGDLAHLTGQSSGSVCGALSMLKKAGRIYTQKDDDGDGQSKWHSNEESI